MCTRRSASRLMSQQTLQSRLAECQEMLEDEMERSSVLSKRYAMLVAEVSRPRLFHTSEEGEREAARGVHEERRTRTARTVQGQSTPALPTAEPRLVGCSGELTPRP